MNEWISVNERLPACTHECKYYEDENVSGDIVQESDVVLFRGEGKVFAGVFDEYDLWWGYFPGNIAFTVHDVTHWMPLPEPPKETNK